MTKDRRRHPLRLAGAAVALALATTGSAAAQASRTWFGPSVRAEPAYGSSGARIRIGRTVVPQWIRRMVESRPTVGK